ncbi:MAG: hypothetical protein QXD95_07520 [Nitrososphaeria archaeon]
MVTVKVYENNRDIGSGSPGMVPREILSSPSADSLLTVLAIESKIFDKIYDALKLKDILEELIEAYKLTSSYKAWIVMNLLLKCKMLLEGGSS